jgi:hypothetical protein
MGWPLGQQAAPPQASVQAAEGGAAERERSPDDPHRAAAVHTAVIQVGGYWSNKRVVG